MTTQEKKNLALWKALGKEPRYIGRWNPATDKIEYEVMHPNSIRTGVR